MVAQPPLVVYGVNLVGRSPVTWKSNFSLGRIRVLLSGQTVVRRVHFRLYLKKPSPVACWRGPYRDSLFNFPGLLTQLVQAALAQLVGSLFILFSARFEVESSFFFFCRGKASLFSPALGSGETSAALRMSRWPLSHYPPSMKARFQLQRPLLQPPPRGPLSRFTAHGLGWKDTPSSSARPGPDA